MAAGVSNLIGSPIAAIATNASAALVTIEKMEIDARNGKHLSVGDVLSVVGNFVSMAAALTITLSPVGRAAGVFAKVAIGVGMGQVLTGGISAETASAIPDTVSSLFNATHTYTPANVPTLVWEVRRFFFDPLTLDLDGDGIETHGIDPAQPIYFDHTGAGVAQASGWISADDGFLVLDRNSNGLIDNGTELFGDSTPLADGGKAFNGFHALAQEDTNQDGWVDALDARFAELRVWRDLNQNGSSEADELQDLATSGIQALKVDATPNYQLLTNGNVLADVGSFIRSDGSTADMGTTQQLGDVYLAADTFRRRFTDAIPLTEQAIALPGMQGSGQVRDLRVDLSLNWNDEPHEIRWHVFIAEARLIGSSPTDSLAANEANWSKAA